MPVPAGWTLAAHGLADPDKIGGHAVSCKPLGTATRLQGLARAGAIPPLKLGLALSVQHRPEDSQAARFAEHVEPVRVAQEGSR